jgi:hypothetical protein
VSLRARVESDEDELLIRPVVRPGHFPDILSQALETDIPYERGILPVQPNDGVNDRERGHHQRRLRTVQRFGDVNDKPLCADWVISQVRECGGFRFRIGFVLPGVLKRERRRGQPGIDKVRIDLTEIGRASHLRCRAADSKALFRRCDAWPAILRKVHGVAFIGFGRLRKAAGICPNSLVIVRKIALFGR